MPDVRCDADACVHWRSGNRCGAGGIEVLNEGGVLSKTAQATFCGTFTPADLIEVLLGAAHDHRHGELFPLGGGPSVLCTVVTCRHWGEGNTCHADAIDVRQGEGRVAESTCCATFALRPDGTFTSALRR